MCLLSQKSVLEEGRELGVFTGLGHPGKIFVHRPCTAYGDTNFAVAAPLNSSAPVA
jgi:hypothetical protein